MEWQRRAGGVGAMWGEDLPARAVALAWLGQAGFAIRHGGMRMLVDPYLSDHLANKYRGSEFPHIRMMKAPVAAAELQGTDLVLCSHRHSDHMDPGSLPAIAAASSRCRFVVPRAEMEAALKAGIPAERMIGVNAGESIDGGEGIRIDVVASAHEQIRTNERGEHHFLGFILRLGCAAIYHSGDCVVYEGLAAELRRQRIDLALLPVNGRDAYRNSRGVIGNMTFEEAAQLCREAGIGRMMPHHFGMFEFNTVDVNDLRRWAAGMADVECLTPQIDSHLLLT